jgi:hypothetical protein
MPSRLLFAVSSLVLASLACATLQRLISAPSTPVPPPATTRQPTNTPAPIASPVPFATAVTALENPAELTVDLRPGQGDVLGALPMLTRYEIDVAVDIKGGDRAVLDGAVRITYTNTELDPIADIVLALWPNNDDQYLSDMHLGPVRVDGVEVEAAGGDADIMRRLRLPEPLASGAQVVIEATFVVEAFGGIDDSGAARFGLTNGVLLAPTFYPLIPRRINGEWDTLLAPPSGDTTNSDSAVYVYRVTAPIDMAIAASGRVIDSTVSGDTQTQTLIAAPMRDLALVVGPLTTTSVELDGITINAYVLPENDRYTDDLLDFVSLQLRTLGERIGPYPFTELDVVDAPGAFGGIEYPGLIFIGVVDGSDFFEIATVHEVGHQWFYSTVGSDQLREPWLDEAAASYTEALYYEAKDGPPAYRDYLDNNRSFVRFSDDPSAPIGLPVDAYGPADYSTIVYLKGSLFFDALRTRLGDDAFFTFLNAYYETNSFRFADSAAFQAEAESACGCDLSDLWRQWVTDGGATP